MANTTLNLPLELSAVREFRGFAEQVSLGISSALSIVINAQAARESECGDYALLSITAAHSLIGLCQASAALLADKASRLADQAGRSSSAP